MKQTLKSTRLRCVDPYGLPERDELWRVDWKQFGYPFCGVYVISPDNGWPSKIGISERPTTRLNELQTAHWNPLIIAAYGFCESRAKARAVEKRAHAILQEDAKHLLGEWFDMRPEQAAEIVQFAADAEGVELASELPDDDRFEEVLEYLRGVAERMRRMSQKRALEAMGAAKHLDVA